MCAGAIMHSRISRVIYGSPRSEDRGSWQRSRPVCVERPNHHATVEGGCWPRVQHLCSASSPVGVKSPMKIHVSVADQTLRLVDEVGTLICAYPFQPPWLGVGEVLAVFRHREASTSFGRKSVPGCRKIRCSFAAGRPGKSGHLN